jgi:hypothetical protein
MKDKKKSAKLFNLICPHFVKTFVAKIGTVACTVLNLICPHFVTIFAAKIGTVASTVLNCCAFRVHEILNFPRNKSLN